MSKSLPVVPATASEVREAVTAMLVAGEVTLSEAAQRNLTSRGRVHPEVRQAFNATVTPKRRYVEGAVRQVPLTYKRVTASGSRNVTTLVPEAEARALAGDAAGKRGPLSAKAKAAAGIALAERVNA